MSTLLQKKSAHPQGYKVKQASHKEEPSPPTYTWKTTLFITPLRASTTAKSVQENNKCPPWFSALLLAEILVLKHFLRKYTKLT